MASKTSQEHSGSRSDFLFDTIEPSVYSFRICDWLPNKHQKGAYPMADTNKADEAALKRMLDLFRNTKPDEAAVHAVEQRLELRIVGTEAYIPSYTRGVMDKNFGAPVMAMNTRTELETKCVFLSPARDPEAKDARKLRSADSMGPAYIAFGVPLRKLKLKLDATRQVVLPLNTLEVPDEGVVYWASFSDIEKNRRDLDQVILDATRKEKTAQAKAKKEAKRAAKRPSGTPPKSA
jgi:hypothetical protein